MRLSALLGLTLTLGPVLLAGCSPELPEDGSDEDLEAKRTLHAWVVLERVEADNRVRTNVSAKFLQIADADVPLALKLVGARPNVPESGDCVAIADLDALSLSSDAAPGLSDEPAAAIDLVDVGDVSLAVPNLFGNTVTVPIRLAPRAFPDIGDFVSGVVYTSPDAAIGLPVPADYEIGGSGSTAVDAFLIDVRAPNAPSGVVVAGYALPDASDADGSEPSLVVRAGADIELSWSADQDAGRSADEPAGEGLVYVDIRGVTAHRCTFPDRGAAVLPQDVLQEADQDVTLSLHRLVQRSALLRGSPAVQLEDAQEATVVFDFARAVRLSVRPRAL
jgi:hypothetical protein